MNTTLLDKHNHEKIQALSAAMSMAILDKKTKKLEFQIKSDLNSFLDRITCGLNQITKINEKLVDFEPDTFTQETINGISKLSRKNTGLQKAALDSLLGLGNNMPIREVVGVNENTTKALCKACFEIYNEGRYKEAAAAFSILAILDPANHDVWIALGNSEYFCQRYKSCLIAYSMAALADPENPKSHFLAAYCYEALNQLTNALNSLEIGLYVLYKNPKYKELEKNAILHKKHLIHVSNGK